MPQIWSSGEEITAAKLNNRRGFPSLVRARETVQLNITAGGNDCPLHFNTEDFDVNDEFDCPASRTGIATATTANHLIDTTNNQFVPADVGRYVYNSTDKTYSKITVYNSPSDLTLAANIMANGEGYRIFGTRFTAKVAGYYHVFCQLRYGITYDGYEQVFRLYKNGATNGPEQIIVKPGPASAAGQEDRIIQSTTLIYLDIGDYLEFMTAQYHSNNLAIDTALTFMTIHMISEL